MVKAFEFHKTTDRETLSILHCTVAIGNPERHVRKASHRGSKQSQNQRNATGEVATVPAALVPANLLR